MNGDYPTIRLMQLRRQAIDIAKQTTLAVADARAAGESWATIAECLRVKGTVFDTPIGNWFPTGVSTTAVRNMYVDRLTSDGRTIR